MVHNASLPDKTVVANGSPPDVPILEVDVEHIMTCEEPDEEAVYDDDEESTYNEADGEGGEGEDQENQAEDEPAPIIDDM